MSHLIVGSDLAHGELTNQPIEDRLTLWKPAEGGREEVDELANVQVVIVPIAEIQTEQAVSGWEEVVGKDGLQNYDELSEGKCCGVHGATPHWW